MKVAINGASVAGLCAAIALGQAGHDVVLVERSTQVRSGGIAVDVRGDALRVAERLGVADQLREKRVGYGPQFEFIDEVGVVRAAVDPNDDVYESPDDLEVSRDALIRVLEAQLPDTVTRIFNASVERVEDTYDGRARVKIGNDEPHLVDLVVGADGLHSRIRRLVFGDEHRFLRFLGLYIGVLRRCETSIKVPATTVYNEPGRLVLVRGDGVDCSAVLGFSSEWLRYDYRDSSIQRALVTAAFESTFGWRTQELVSEVSTSPDFYFDSVCQVIMPKWHQGSSVLIGDAGYCASFFSGMGTSLAMRGALTLADAIAGSSSVTEALDEYERCMRPAVDDAQALAAEGIDLLFPRTHGEIAERNARISGVIATSSRSTHISEKENHHVRR